MLRKLWNNWKRFSCWMGWHDGKGAGEQFDGVSFHSKCSKCGKKVLQDSQGNWFEYGRNNE